MARSRTALPLATVAALGAASVVALAPSASAAGCGNVGTLHIGKQANHHDVRLACGQKLLVSLSENRDGGPNSARWIAKKVDRDVLDYLGKHWVAPPDGAPLGAPGTAKFSYDSVGKGTTELRIVLRVPNDPDPVKRFHVTVIVS